MEIRSNISLMSYSTMGLGGNAKYLVELHDKSQIPKIVSWANEQQLPIMTIGIGSNIVWSDNGFNGLIIVNKLLKYEIYEEDEINSYITVGAGENWDDTVEKTVQAGLSGIEALSLVPGTAGATPIQNVGAYGQEISQTLASLEAFDTQTNAIVNIAANDCGFGYRTSRFKTVDKNRFIITSITLHLMKTKPLPPFYSSLQNYLDANGITEYTPITIRNAVIAIRVSKLPDPIAIKNCGSFFANPIINDDKFREIEDRYPVVPHWVTDDKNVKLSAAWLIEQAGFKDKHDSETGMATWPQQALVLINESAKTTADLLAFKQKIIYAVQDTFNITLEQEPELV